MSLTKTPLAARRLTSTTPLINRSLSLLPIHSPPTLRPFSSTPPQQSDDAHSHYDPPSGWLWGIPPGEKKEKEGWENMWIYGFYGSLLVGVVGYIYKPDTSIQTWALEEARRRLEAEGILPDPTSKN
ncbi:MAG: hypothetical protein Q9166_000395 [cf. Caloplaca sp. 2 TL-2023]